MGRQGVSRLVLGGSRLLRGRALLQLEAVEQCPEVAHVRLQQHRSPEPGARLIRLPGTRGKGWVTRTRACDLSQGGDDNELNPEGIPLLFDITNEAFRAHTGNDATRTAGGGRAER